MDELNSIKVSAASKYKIISETAKMFLEPGKSIGLIELDEPNEPNEPDEPNELDELDEPDELEQKQNQNQNQNYYKSSTLINQNSLFDGLTELEILCVNSNILVKKIQIRTRAKNKEILHSYRDILWDLEFKKTKLGYKILGLNNFIHISLVGCEEVFFDIIYKLDPIIGLNNGLNNGLKQNKMIELKFTRCIYNKIIRANLNKFLYENEESYSVDIIDYIKFIGIDIDQEEKRFGNIYSTSYNILRIMSGMSGLCYTN